MPNLDQPAAAVSGVSSGIGKMIAVVLEASGRRAFAGVRRQADGLVPSRGARHDLMPVLLDSTSETAIGNSLDEVLDAVVNPPETLGHVCDGIDAVFFSVGSTRQKDWLTIGDVDYQGTKNLLDVALRVGVQKVVYVTAVREAHLRPLDISDAHEARVDGPEALGLAHTGVRPTGYFSPRASE